VSLTRTMVIAVGNASTTHQQLVEARLGMTIAKWIAKNHLSDVSVRDVAERLSKDSGTPVSKTTLHRWLN
jgi:hypothetical protein